MLGIADHFQIDDTVYIVTKWQSGGDLLTYMSARGETYLTEELALHIFV